MTTIEAIEEALIAYCINEANGFQMVVDKDCRSDFFLSERYKEVFKAMESLCDSNTPINIMSLTIALKGIFNAAEVTMFSMPQIPWDFDVQGSIDFIREQKAKRVLKSSLNKALHSVEESNASEVLDDIVKKQEELKIDSSSVLSLEDLQDEMINDLSSVESSIKSGFDSFDKPTGAKALWLITPFLQDILA
jgi:replicative DNA helicase